MRSAVTAAVPVSGEGVAAIVVLVANVGLVPYWKLGNVDVDPTVRVPFNVADVDVVCVAAFVVTVTAVFQLARLASVKDPPRAASRARSSFASYSFRSAITSAGSCPAAISAL